MEEKTYKLLGGSGALNIAVGAVVLVSGIAKKGYCQQCWGQCP